MSSEVAASFKRHAPTGDIGLAQLGGRDASHTDGEYEHVHETCGMAERINVIWDMLGVRGSEAST